MGSNKCKVCGQQAEVLRANGWLHMDCIRCGDFFIEPEVVEDNQDKLNDQVIITKISGWIRENQREKIDASKFDWLVNKLVIPNVYEKAQRLIKWLNKKTTYPGQTVLVKLSLKDSDLIELLSSCWAYNEEEIIYLIEYLIERKFLAKSYTGNKNYIVTITPAGFLYIEDMQKNSNSNLGFCAMWFDEEVKPVWENAIEPAIKQAGYDPKRIDAHPHNGVIVDEIISLIRRSKFIISDLTGSRGGVYFEAGFAKGLGLEVIFTCRKDHLENNLLHFDVRHYNFLTWETEKYDEFKKNLTLRIEGTLGRGRK